MVKIIFFISFLSVLLHAQMLNEVDTKRLDTLCLACHSKQQIPNDLIYRRYLMVYSTHKRMNEAIFKYMKHPNKKYSVMHHPFFFKFPMKKISTLDDKSLKEMIEKYLITFDIKKKFESKKLDN